MTEAANLKPGNILIAKKIDGVLYVKADDINHILAKAAAYDRLKKCADELNNAVEILLPMAKSFLILKSLQADYHREINFCQKTIKIFAAFKASNPTKEQEKP